MVLDPEGVVAADPEGAVVDDPEGAVVDDPEGAVVADPEGVVAADLEHAAEIDSRDAIEAEHLGRDFSQHKWQWRTICHDPAAIASKWTSMFDLILRPKLSVERQFRP